MNVIVATVVLFLVSLVATAQQFDSECTRIVWSEEKTDNKPALKVGLWVAETLGNGDIVAIGVVTNTENTTIGRRRFTLVTMTIEECFFGLDDKREIQFLSRNTLYVNDGQTVRGESEHFDWVVTGDRLLTVLRYDDNLSTEIPIYIHVGFLRDGALTNDTVVYKEVGAAHDWRSSDTELTAGSKQSLYRHLTIVRSETCTLKQALDEIFAQTNSASWKGSIDE